MDEFELNAFLLARILPIRSDECTTRVVAQIGSFPVTEKNTKTIDDANLPFLVGLCASGNVAASNFIENHRKIKRAKMAKERHIVFEKFHNAIMRKFKGMAVPNKIVQVLLNMLQIPNPLYAQTALRLLYHLNIGTKTCEYITENLGDLCRRHPGGDILLQKIQFVIAEGGDVADNGLDHNDDEEFNKDIGEVLMKVFTGLMLSGNPERIEYGINLFGQFSLSLDLYKKYEITSMIMARARHCKAAMDYMHKINNLEKTLMEKEHAHIFNHLLQSAKHFSTIQMDMMNLLLEYVKTGTDEQARQVADVLIEKNVTLTPIQHRNVYMFLANLPRQIENMEMLVGKWRLITSFFSSFLS